MAQRKGWSDAARKASAEARRSGATSAPHFTEYAAAKLGPNWTLAKATPKNKERYSNVTFVTPTRFDAVKKSFAKDHPDAARAYFGDVGNYKR